MNRITIEMTISEMHQLKSEAERKIAEILQGLCDETGLEYKSLQVHPEVIGHGREWKLIISGVTIELGFW